MVSTQPFAAALSKMHSVSRSREKEKKESDQPWVPGLDAAADLFGRGAGMFGGRCTVPIRPRL